MNKKILPLALFFVIVIIAFYLISKQFNKTTVDSFKPNNNIQITSSKSSLKSKKLSFTGFSELQKINLVSEIGGKVEHIYAQNGQFLKKGDKIISLENKDFAEKYESAKKKLESAKIRYASILRLGSKGLTSSKEKLDAETAILDAESEIKVTQHNIDNLIIKAPFDGIIDEIKVKLGNYLPTIKASFNLVDALIAKFYSDKRVKVNFSVPLMYFNDVKSSKNIEFFDVMTDDKLGTSKLHFISNIAENNTKTYHAEAFLDAKELFVNDNQVLKVVVCSNEIPAHKVPQSAILKISKNEIGLKVIDVNKVVKIVPVEIIDEDTNGIWITGLPEEAEIITLGQYEIKEGEKLSVQ